ncbi:hypothetical protein [Corynebacterium singulare]|uniref:Uncharacterized protein n=1 Tax=Corynebacterium singulare TaxID=161899 RepID=A0ABS9PVK4_9CORY|nr:hypothetical protein [Corynebacterium singulare]MCG7276734.1 hypothetical protein [Corynebacterium singulare]
MGGAFSYASFSRANGRAGGWGVGQKVGDLTQEELAELVSFVPTTLNNGTSIPDFPSAQQRAELVRRTAVFALTPEADKWVTMVSVPAGLDATGRGGNVFTYTSITRTGTPPVPSTVLYSPDIPAPFSIYEVDKVQIPESISARGPLHSDVLLDEFLEGEFRQPEKLPAPFKSVTPNPNSTFNHALVSAMATVLNSRNGLVILVAPDNQAALWIAATAREVGEDGFGFSTFERAAAINEFPLSTSTMIVVPPSEKQRLADTAIPGNPVVFAVDEALPDVSAFERPTQESELSDPSQYTSESSSLHEESEASSLSTGGAGTADWAAGNTAGEGTDTQSNCGDPWAADGTVEFGSPASDASPFAAVDGTSSPFPPNPLEAPNPLGSQHSSEGLESPVQRDTALAATEDDGLPLNAASGNPFAVGGVPPSTASSDTSAQPPAAPSTSAAAHGEQTASERKLPSTNAVVPALSAEEHQKLVAFDARWWIEYLDVHRGRSIQLAYLDKTALGDGLDKLLMSAVIASWVFYFPRDFELLAADALRPWENRDLEHIANLTADHFVGTFRLDQCDRHVTGRVAMVLDEVQRMLAERAERAQQHQAGWQNQGSGQGRGYGF